MLNKVILNLFAISTVLFGWFITKTLSFWNYNEFTHLKFDLPDWSPVIVKHFYVFHIANVCAIFFILLSFLLSLKKNTDNFHIIGWSLCICMWLNMIIVVIVAGMPVVRY